MWCVSRKIVMRGASGSFGNDDAARGLDFDDDLAARREGGTRMAPGMDLGAGDGDDVIGEAAEEDLLDDAAANAVETAVVRGGRGGTQRHVLGADRDQDLGAGPETVRQYAAQGSALDLDQRLLARRRRARDLAGDEIRRADEFGDKARGRAEIDRARIAFLHDAAVL